jgi:hypothetical protein
MYEEPEPVMVSAALAAGPVSATEATSAAAAIMPLTLRIEFISLFKFCFRTPSVKGNQVN